MTHVETDAAGTGNVVYPLVFRQITPPTSEELRQLRKRLGMSQRMFTQHFCLDLESFCRWEQGRGKPERVTIVYLKLIMADPLTIMDMLDGLKDLR